MNTTDPYRYDDAAYVLGALSADERAAFEAHLLSCDECVQRVREIESVPDLLAGLTEADLADDPMPETLLPSLLRRASVERRRRRFTLGAFAAVAAACVAALVVALWPSTTSTGPTGDKFVAVAPSPVSATATLTAQNWGTSIDVHCRYLDNSAYRSYTYDLVAFDRHGGAHRLGDWRLPPDKDIDYRAGTSLRPGQISKVEITLPDGRPLLRLNT